MKKQKYSIAWSTQFKKDYKRTMKQHLDISLLDVQGSLASLGAGFRKLHMQHAA